MGIRMGSNWIQKGLEQDWAAWNGFRMGLLQIWDWVGEGGLVGFGRDGNGMGLELGSDRVQIGIRTGLGWVGIGREGNGMGIGLGLG